MNLVSIIIPHFNRPALLQQAIDSVKAQTYPDWEILVVDDKSDNRVYSDLQTLASEKIQIFQRRDEPKGPSACRNIGAEKAKGKYLIFLDSDDMLMLFC